MKPVKGTVDERNLSYVVCRRFDAELDARRLYEAVMNLGYAARSTSAYLSLAAEVDTDDIADGYVLPPENEGKSFVTLITEDRYELHALIAQIPGELLGDEFGELPPSMLDAMFARRALAKQRVHDHPATVNTVNGTTVTRYDYDEPKTLGPDGRMR